VPGKAPNPSGRASSNRAATCERCGGAKFIRAAGDAGRTVRAACPDCAPPEWMPGHRHHVDTRGDSGLYFCLVCGEDFTSRPDDTVECPGPGRAIPNSVPITREDEQRALEQPHPVGQMREVRLDARGCNVTSHCVA
jgi:DNA-directed RNA polymerase subunit RPC12/RpoP